MRKGVWLIKKPYNTPSIKATPFGIEAMSSFDRLQAGDSVDTNKTHYSGHELAEIPPRKFHGVWRKVDGSINDSAKSPTEDSISAFKDRFSALTSEEQEDIYNFSLQVARKFCREVLEPRETLIEEDDEIFEFPFARILLSDFDSINSIWEFMDRTLDKTEGPRFVIDSTLGVFVFGRAKCHMFRSSPVIDFTEVFSSQIPGNNKTSKTQAFVLHGREQIFYIAGDLENSSIKIRQTHLAMPLWKLARLPMSPSIVKETIKEFIRFQVLAHEHGHVLSFNDELVADMILNPIYEHDGQEHVHPSHSRFHDMGEVYAELFGFIDALIEKRSDEFTLLAFACYTRTLASTSENARARAFALINLFLRNVHLDRDNVVDYDGLRRDADAQKAFFYDQFEMYKHIEEDRIESWINGGMYMAIIANGLQKAFGMEAGYDSSGKSPVEVIFRNQLIESMELGIRINRSDIHGSLRMLRRRLWSAAHNLTSPFDRDSMERDIASRVPGMIDEILRGPVAHAVEEYILADKLRLREKHFSPHNSSIDTESVPSYVDDINTLLRIQSILDDHEIPNRQELEDYATNVRTIKGRYSTDAEIGILCVSILNQIHDAMQT